MDSIIKNMNLFVDGRNYAGMADTVTPPTLTTKTEEYRGAGMSSPVDISLGIEKLESSWEMSEYNADIVGLWCSGYPVSIVFRGAATGENNDDAKPIILTMRGIITSLDRGSWTSGEVAKLTVTSSIHYYKEEINGVKIHEIDSKAYIQIVNGVDVMDKTRRALAL